MGVRKDSDSLTFTVEADNLDGGFIAQCDQYPGAISQGETQEEAVRNARHAIEDIRNCRKRKEQERA